MPDNKILLEGRPIAPLADKKGELMIYNMRASRVLKKMREGKVATCTKMNTCDQRVIEIAALCGFDCIWLDR